MPVWRSAFLLFLLAPPGFALAPSVEDEEAGTDEPPMDGDEPPMDGDEPPMDGDEELATEMHEGFTPEKLQKLHAKMDADANGKLSLDEVLKSFTHTRKIAAAKDGKSMMEMVDDNKDGKVSLDELLKYTHTGPGDEHVDAPEEKAELDKEKSHEVDKFHAADRNSDGVLDEFELGTFFNPDAHDDVLQFIALEAIAEKDHDKDGLLTINEFFNVTSTINSEQDSEEQEESEQMFKKLDKDGSGKLDVKELLLFESGHFYTVDAMEKFMQLADTDGDQHVTVAEFHSAHKEEDEASFHFMEMAQHHEL